MILSHICIESVHNVQVDPVADGVKEEREKTNQHGKKEEKPEKAERKKRPSLGFFHGFAASVSVIIVSELGDKTFFIAAILAMKYSRFVHVLFAPTEIY